MTKNVLLICLIMGFSTCSMNSVKNPKEHDRELILKYKIKTVTEYVTSWNLGINEHERTNNIKSYNAKGLLTKETGFLKDGNIDFNSTNQYDKNDNLLSRISVKRDGTFISKIVRRYDQKNNLTELFRFEERDGPYMYGNTYTYDSKGRMKVCNWFWPSGLKAVDTYTYKGNLMIENVNLDSKGNFRFKWVNKYDPGDNLKESTQYYPNKIIQCRIVYQYNEKNELMELVRYFGETVQYRATYQYDKNGLLFKKMEYDPMGKISAQYRYRYEKY